MACRYSAWFFILDKRHCANLWHLIFGSVHIRLSIPKPLYAWSARKWHSHLLHKALGKAPYFWFEEGKTLGQWSLEDKKHEFLVVDGHQFSHPGSYTLKPEHFMRTDTLPGVQAVDIKVTVSRQHAPWRHFFYTSILSSLRWETFSSIGII